MLRRPEAEFDSVDKEELEIRGVRTRALQFPEGSRDKDRAVVCIAGMGANGRSFSRQRPLARDEFFLLLNTPVDTPDDVDPLEFSIDVVEEYIRHEGLQRAVIVGSSFGGAVAAMIALRRPELVRGLVLVSAVVSRSLIPLANERFVDLLEAPQPLAALVAPIAAEIMGGFSLGRDARNEIVREARHFTGAELKRRLRSLMALDLFPRLSQIRCPTLVVHGTRDLLVPWKRGRRIAEVIPGARLAILKGAGHLPYLSHADAFNAALRDFLDSLERTRVRAHEAERRAQPLH